MRRPTLMRTCVIVVSAGALGVLVGPLPTSLASAASTPTCDGKTATIVGTDRKDVIYGTAGNDVIVGLRGWDQLLGGGGNDTICGGRGADHLYGGSGADWLQGGPDGLLFDEDQYGDKVDGGGGNDTVSGGAGLYSGDRGLDVLVYPRNEAPLTVDLQAETATFKGQQDRVLNIEYVNGTDFADTLTGDGYFNFMSGYGGDDTLVGLGGVDFLYGDDGNDLVKGGSGDDLLSGDAGTDVGNGGDGDDYCNTFETRVACEHP